MRTSVSVLSPSKRQALGMYSSGNRCGHDPENPRLISYVNPYTRDDWDNEHDRDDFGHRKKSRFFYEFDALMDDFYHYPKMLRSLGFHTDDHGNDRKVRSEGREANIAFLKFLTHYMDLPSRRLGYPDKGGFVYYDYKFMMKHTGLSKSRLKRTIKRMVYKGYIERQKRWTERSYGKFKALTTATVVNVDLLFGQLGILDEFKEAANHSAQRLKAMATQLGVTVKSMLKCSTLDFLKPKKNKPATKNPDDYPPTDHRHWQFQLHNARHGLFQAKTAELLKFNPDMDRTEAYRQAFLAVK